ncbi:hypothetical protein [Corallococcus sp. CA053C]|nr:hypothetical protein [Corallococcus sp. CA053C]
MYPWGPGVKARSSGYNIGSTGSFDRGSGNDTVTVRLTPKR